MTTATSPLRLLLASASPARLSTLRAAGIEPAVRVSRVDEDAVLHATTLQADHALDPAEQVLVLARAKAEDVAAGLLEDAGLRHEGVSAESGADRSGAAHTVTDIPDLVIGCDSMLELDGVVMGKPGTVQVARERWRSMRGTSGLLHTGHWLIDLREPDGLVVGEGATSTTRVHFADLSDDEIDAYIASEEPLRVAGAFTIDGLGGPFISRIEGDHHGVVGISLPVLRELLGRRNVAVHQLWGSGRA